jgi:hypothetical protein
MNMEKSIDNREVRECLNSLVKAKQRLRDLDVIRSERLVGEIGEWLVESLFGGSRAESSSQKGFDIVKDNSKIQVKTHAKGDDNNARWTQFGYKRGEFDFLVIVVMSKELYLKEVFYIPENVTIDRIDTKKKQRVVDWDKYKDFSIPLDQLPNQDLVQLFRIKDS